MDVSTFNDHIESEVRRLRDVYGEAQARAFASLSMTWREHDPNLALVRAGSIAWWNERQRHRRPIPAPRVRLVATPRPRLYTAPVGSPPPRTLDGWTEVRGIR